MVESDRDLHVPVLSVRVTVSQKHHLVMMGHVVVRDRDGRGPVDGVDEPVPAV